MPHLRFQQKANELWADEEAVAPPSGFTHLNLKAAIEFHRSHEFVNSLHYAPDGRYVIVGFGDGEVDIYDTAKPAKARVYKVLKRKVYADFPIMCIRHHPIQGDNIYFSSARGVMHAGKISTETCDELFSETNNDMASFDFNADGSELATTGKDFSVRLYDQRTSRKIREWEGYNPMERKGKSNTHASRVFCLKYQHYHQDSPSMREMFATGGWDNMIKIWDSRMKEGVVKTIPGPHICGDSLDIFGYQLLSGSWTKTDTLQIHDLRYNKVLHSLPLRVDFSGKAPDSGEYVYCCRFYDPDTVVAGGSGTHSLQAISIGKHEVIGQLALNSKDQRVVSSVDVHPDGKQLMFGGRGETMVIADLT